MNAAIPAATGWCTFTVAGRHCAVEVTRVQEVLRPLPVTPLPLAPPAVRGLVNLRGHIVPVVDLRVVLGLPAGPAAAAGGHVIVHDGETPVALLVDAIGDVRRAEGAALVPVPHTLEGPAGELVAGALPLPDELLLALDLDRTLDRAFEGADVSVHAGRTERPAGGTP